MAMRAVKHGPDQRGLLPPLGPATNKLGKAKAQPHREFKATVHPLSKMFSSAMPMRTTTVINEIDVELIQEFKRLGLATARSSEGGGGGGKEWRPSWNKDYGGGIALWNLLANAELMTPVGRKFIPNPHYKGNGLSPPQKDPLATHFDNVVDLAQVRTRALIKTRHSERSRGKVHSIVGGPPPTLDVPVQQTTVSTAVQASNDDTYVDVMDDVRTKDWGKLDLSAFGWDAANEDMLSGNTDEEVRRDPTVEKHDRMLENMCYFPHHVGTQLAIDGFFQISPSCVVNRSGKDEVTLEFQLKSGYKAVRRMSDDQFYYRLDDNGIPFNAYLWHNEAPYQLMDEVTYDVFSFGLTSDWDSHEGFETWSNSDLAKLYHWHTQSHWERGVEIAAVFEGVNAPVSQSELWIWEGEAYRNELDKVSKLREKHKLYLQSQARYKVFGAPKAEIKLGLPVIREHDDSPYHLYWLRKNILGDLDVLTNQWKNGDDNRLQYWLATRSASQDAQPEDKDVWQLARQRDFIRSTTVKRDAKEAIVLGATEAWNKLVDVLNTPVSQFFKRKPKVVAKIDPVVPTTEQIDAVAEGMAVRMIYLGSLHDDQYDLDYLERLAGRRLDPNKPLPSAVELAIQAANLDVPTEEFSEGGIFLGKSVQLPRTEAGLILPTHMPHR